METLNIYGTLGPSCHTKRQIQKMFQLGMTGMRLNLSHTNLSDHPEWLKNFNEAKAESCPDAQLLIDMKGPEIRIGDIRPTTLKKNQVLCLSKIAVPSFLNKVIRKGQVILLDDGMIALEALDSKTALVTRGGILLPHKSITLVNKEVDTPILTDSDIENLKVAKQFGVTGIMQPFVRSAKDLQVVCQTLHDLDLDDIQVFAKIENQSGYQALESLFPYCHEIIIARGDLGNAVGLIQLPSIQHRIERICQKHHKRYMLVTQMLHSMMEKDVPTRAEVNDIYMAVYNGASSIMLTGEIAAGKYPEQAMKFFAGVAKTALRDREER